MAERIGLEAILDMAKFNGNVDNYLRAVNKMDSETGSVGQRVGQSFDAVGKGMLAAAAVAATAAVAVTAAIAAFVVDGVKQAMTLDEGMARIAATLNTTKDAVKPLKDEIISLALDPKLKVTADEAALAIENLAKNGLSMDQILAGAARSTVLLANATGANLGMAADIATDVMAQFNIEAENMSHAVDQITGVTNLSKFTIDDYRLAIAQAGGVAGQVGVSFEDFNAVIASTSPSFASGSDAGTSFKTFLQRLVPTTEKAKDAVDLLGLEFFDASGDMKSMADISEELNQAFLDEITFSSQVSGMTAEQTAQKAMLEGQLKKTGMELFKYSIGLNGVAQSEEDKIVSIDRLNRQHDAAMAAYGSLAGAMGTTVSVTRELTEAEKIQYANTIFGTDAIRTAFGLAESGAVLYTDLATAAKELGVSQEEVNKVIEGGVTQFEAMQLQIAKMDAESQAATRMDNLKGKIEILKGQIDALKLSIGDALLPALSAMTSWASEFVATHSQSVIDFFANLVKAIGDTVTKIQEGQPFFDALTGGLQTGFGENGRIVGENIAAIAKSVNDFYTAVTTILQPLTDVVAGFVSWKDVLIILAGSVAVVVIPAIAGMVAAVAAIALPIAAAVLAVAALRTAWETDFGGLRTKVTEALDAVSLRFADLTTAIKTNGAGALQEIVAFATGNETNWTNVKAIWTEASTAGGKLFADLQSYVTSNLPGWQSKLTEWGAAASEWIANAIPVVTAKINEWYTVLSGNLATQLGLWKLGFIAWANATWDWLPGAAVRAATELTAWFVQLSGYLAEKIPQWQAGFTAWASATWEWLAPAALKAGTELGVWVGQLIGYLAAKIPDWIVATLQLATALVSWLTSKEADALPHLGTWLGKIIAWIGIAATALIAETVKLTFALIGWIANDLVPKVAPELGKFSVAIIGGIVEIGLGIVEAMKNMATSMFDTLLTVVNWYGGGQTVVSKIKDGLGSMAASLVNAAGKVAKDMWQKFKDIDWLSLGKDIVQGIIDGFDALKNDLINRAKMLADDLPAWMKKLLGIESPSKVFYAIGENVMLGFINGMDSLSNRAAETIGRIADNTISRAKAAGYGASGLIAGVIGGFQGSGKGFAEGLTADLANIQAALNKVYSTPQSISGPNARIDVSSLLTRQYAEIGGDKYRTGTALSDQFSRVKPGSEAAMLEAEYNKSKQALVYNAMLTDQTEQYKKQLELVRLIRESGGDPAAVLGDMLGSRAGIDNQKYLTVINQITETLNNKLAKSINAVKLNFDGMIKSMADGRRTVASIEKQFAGSGDQQKNLTDNIALWDQYIAAKEEALRSGEGDANTLKELESFNASRNGLAGQLETLLRQKAEFQALQNRLGTNISDPIVARIKASNLDPILAKFNAIGATEEQRNQLMVQYRQEQEKILAIQQKQQQVTFLSDQLALIKQAQEMAKNFPGLVNMQDIFGGLTLGMNASTDDLLTAVKRVMDAMIATTNAQLGIASPSKVFAKIGQYTMEGFAQGITSGIKMPALSMAGAVSSVAQAPMISRNFTMNTGPIAINNGMNEASFRAMIRSEVGKML